MSNLSRDTLIATHVHEPTPFASRELAYEAAVQFCIDAANQSQEDKREYECSDFRPTVVEQEGRLFAAVIPKHGSTWATVESAILLAGPSKIAGKEFWKAHPDVHMSGYEEHWLVAPDGTEICRWLEPR